MARTPYDTHLEQVARIVPTLAPRAAFAVAAACVERMWPIYERAARNQNVSDAKLLRETLDSIWDWIHGVGARPDGASERCERAVVEVTPRDDATSGALDIAVSFSGLAGIVEDDEPDGARQAARSNLDFLGRYLYLMLELRGGSEHDLEVYSHPLVEQEIARQMADLRFAQQASDLSQLTELRSRSQGVSLLGSSWYR